VTVRVLPMPKLTNLQWWLLVVVALLMVLAWPPREGKSLGVKLVNRAVDPWDELPVLPGPLPLGQGDDPERCTGTTS